MFSKFNLKLIENDFKDYYAIGKKIYEKTKELYKGSIEDFEDEDNIIDGKKLQEKWFPTDKNYDIFLSHSHNDEDLAIALAGYLQEECKLSVFIDSCLWGYSNDLLKNIDDIYCINEMSYNYDYDKRNYSTSHIHMMLSVALSNMMYKCEAIVFLNTENSINFKNDLENQKTMSPWVYKELHLLNIMAVKELDKYRKNCQKIKNFSYIVDFEAKAKELNISYEVTKLVDNLINITKEDLSYIAKQKDELSHPLDVLYKHKEIIRMEDVMV